MSRHGMKGPHGGMRGGAKAKDFKGSLKKLVKYMSVYKVQMLFVAVFGPGPLAGTVAIAFRSVGFVGKLLGEALEEVPRGGIEALKAAGASQTSQILYGYWPAVKPAFWSIMLLRWDINVRESSVLGLVGAGGLGQQIDLSLRMFAGDEVTSMLLTFVLLVLLADQLSRLLRRELDRPIEERDDLNAHVFPQDWPLREHAAPRLVACEPRENAKSGDGEQIVIRVVHPGGRARQHAFAAGARLRACAHLWRAPCLAAVAACLGA